MSGREMLVVRFWHAEDDYIDACFDRQSYFLLRQEHFRYIRSRTFTVTSSYSDFRMVDGGLIFPFQTEQESDFRLLDGDLIFPFNTERDPEYRRTSKVMSIKLNVRIDPAVFKMPTEH